MIIDPSVGHVIATLPAENVYELGFSPLGTYVITWQRPSKDENGDAVKNLKVWRVVEGSPDGNGDTQEHVIVGRFVQKSQTGWNLQYTHDEKYCARVVTNEVQFYESGDLGTVWNKLRVEGVTDFALSPGNNHAIAVFIPERKVSLATICHFLASLRSQAGLTEHVYTNHLGPPGYCKSFQRAPIRLSSFAKEFLQRRQGSAEVE